MKYIKTKHNKSKFGDSYDYLIVGCGFAGSVLAERLARGLNKKILIIDRRNHIGGNAYDYYNDSGILIHKYGPHIFHTNCERIIKYLSRFTKWRQYEHRVLAHVDNKLVPIPINLTTLNQLYNLNMTSLEAEKFLANLAVPKEVINSSEDFVVSQIGFDLYKKFFQGYTRKQWGLDPSELDKSVTSRIPTRTTTDDRYFTDKFQCMPLDGYTKLFETMLNHPNIEIKLSTDFHTIKNNIDYDKLIYSGPIDEYFNYCYGKLPYRSLKFCHETLDTPVYQPVAVVNYPDTTIPYTRITEYKYLTGQIHNKTSITWEYPSMEGDPFYPIPCVTSQELYKKYKNLAECSPNITFVGRLGSYRYYNMDQIIGQALSIYNRIMHSEMESGLSNQQVS